MSLLARLSRREHAITAAWLLVLIAAGTALRLVLAITTDGTNDVDTWLAFLDASESVGSLNLYSVQSWPTVRTFDFNHGPLVAYTMPLGRYLADLGLDPRMLIRLPAIAADAATAYMVFHLLDARIGSRRAILAAAAIALNPVLILVSGFHGNSDPVFLAFLVAALVFLRREHYGRAGAMIALSLGVKIVPIVVLPFILLGLPTWAARRRLTVAATVTSIPLWVPMLVAGPVDVIREVFLYSGLASRWGLGRLVWGELALDPSGPVRRPWSILVVVLVWLLAVRTSKIVPRPADWSIALGFLVLLAVGPAFGAQYLAWPVPFLALVGLRVSVVYAAAIGTHLYLRYAWWSGGGVTLGHADGWTAPPEPAHVPLTELVAWIVLTAIAIQLLRATGRAVDGVPGRQRTLVLSQ